MARATKRVARRRTTAIRRATAMRRTTATRATGAQSDGETIALLERLKVSLQATRRKLMRVQPDTLDDEQHARWSEQLLQLNLAIGAVRNALLGAISAAFAAELPAIEQATGKLSEDLSRLEASVQVINAVGSAMGIIERVALLVA